MRLSTLTVVVFAAHTSTHVIAAPLPSSNDVQELVARAGEDRASSSSGDPPSSAQENWGKAASAFAKAIPPQLVNVPIKSNFVSVVQKAVSAAANTPPQQRLQSPIHSRPGAQTPSSSSSSTAQRRPSIMQANAFNRPSGGGGLAEARFRDAVERVQQQQQQARQHPGTQNRESGSGQASPARQASPERQGGTTGSRILDAVARSRQQRGREQPGTWNQASSSGQASPARQASPEPQGSSSRRASPVRQGSSSRQASPARQARKVSQVSKAVAGKAAGKRPKLTVRGLEIDELD